jgi:hypothetical protein
MAPLSPMARIRVEKQSSWSPSEALKLEKYVVAQKTKYGQVAHPTIDQFQREQRCWKTLRPCFRAGRRNGNANSSEP